MHDHTLGSIVGRGRPGVSVLSPLLAACGSARAHGVELQVRVASGLWRNSRWRWERWASGLQGFTMVKLLIGFVDLGPEWYGGVLAAAIVTEVEGIVDVISERHGGLVWRRLVFDAKMLYSGLY